CDHRDLYVALCSSAASDVYKRQGRGHVRVGDSSWPVIADEDFAAGSKVEVIAVEGITLRIRPAVG
ncbi:NfeD family protein, partial [Klebsiella pneumoniae]|uniref:NfeD family protein n=1 Tax=Klebsiella pneumoniae TaxID=573 RepID=UPI001D0E6005